MSQLYVYNVPLHQTTVVDATFPEQQWAGHFGHHRLANAISHFIHPHEEHAPLSPRADIRETAKRYYLDIELPGLSRMEDLSVKWINEGTLYLEATINRPKVQEELEQEASAPGDSQEVITDASAAEPSASANKAQNQVHLLVRGRQVGNFIRHFQFTVPVNHDTMEATMSNGLLTLAWEKKPDAQQSPKPVDIKFQA